MSIKVLRTNKECGQLPISKAQTRNDWRYELYVDYDFEIRNIVRSQESVLVPISLRIAFPEGTYGRITSIPDQRHQLMVDVGVIDDEGRICLKLKNCGDDKLMSRLESDPVAHLIVEQVREVALVEVSAAEELL
mmetsp:Transcript_14451/g.21765  ORF Transcript_14451/g.21765 Transcript_14451/m.21765 type:complete len:134 (-) Transcript_14451:149-550(-)